MPLPGEDAMNLNKLPKEKRNQLVLVIMIGLLAISGLGFGLIRYQYDKLALLAQAKAEAEGKLSKIQDAVKHADRLEAEVAAASEKLAGAESDMASGDLYVWSINTLRRFKSSYKVEIPQFGQLDGPRAMTLLPSFPYSQATLTVAGTGHFHDLGRFLADLENQFPHFRVLNLSLDLNPSPASEDRETLSFRMDIVALVKPNAL
jgi:hypothetical protein